MEVILQYVMGFIITLLTIIILNLFGATVTRDKKIDSYSLIIGYIIYSFFVAVGGILIQVLNLPWMAFFCYMIFILISIVGFIIYKLYKKDLIINIQVLKSYICSHWFLYLGAGIITIYGLSHLDYIWSNNLTDDSYYINKMATLPYLDNPFRIDYVTGFSENHISTYIFNTFELEASFYIFITQMKATLYARLFLSLLNYFILLNAIHAFIIKIFDKSNFKKNVVQYFVVPLFILLIMANFLEIDTEASWTIKSAAYFGSSIVRVGGIFIVLLPIISKKKIDISSIIITFMSCVVMVSKSTVAIPLLFVIAIGYLFSLFDKKVLLLGILFIISLFGIGYILPNNVLINEFSLSFIKTNTIQILFVITVIFSLLLMNKITLIKTINIIMICSIILTALPQLNDIFECLSNYQFVADRTLYSLYVWYMVTIFLIVIVYGVNIIKKNILISSILGIFTTFIGVTYIFLIQLNGSDLINSLKVYAYNPYLIPDSTIMLGEALEGYYKETGKELKVFMPAGLELNGRTHFAAAILRSFSPHTISVTGAVRTQTECTNEESDFYGFSVDDLNQGLELYIEPNINSLNRFKEINEKYPFNCIVGQNFGDEHDRLLSTIGYDIYEVLVDEKQRLKYTIYILEE